MLAMKVLDRSSQRVSQWEMGGRCIISFYSPESLALSQGGASRLRHLSVQTVQTPLSVYRGKNIHRIDSHYTDIIYKVSSSPVSQL